MENGEVEGEAKLSRSDRLAAATAGTVIALLVALGVMALLDEATAQRLVGLVNASLLSLAFALYAWPSIITRPLRAVVRLFRRR